MRGSAMGLSLFTGAGLGGEFVVDRPLIRLRMMTLGSAIDPSSFTLLSPNMLVVIELSRSPRILGKLCAVRAAEAEGCAAFVVADDEAGATRVDVVFELEELSDAPPTDSTEVLAVWDDVDAFETTGCGKLCSDPHNFLILGKVSEECAAVFVREGGAFIAERFVVFCCCCFAVVLVVA